MFVTIELTNPIIRPADARAPGSVVFARRDLVTYGLLRVGGLGEVSVFFRRLRGSFAHLADTVLVVLAHSALES